MAHFGLCRSFWYTIRLQCSIATCVYKALSSISVLPSGTILLEYNFLDNSGPQLTDSLIHVQWLWWLWAERMVQSDLLGQWQSDWIQIHLRMPRKGMRTLYLYHCSLISHPIIWSEIYEVNDTPVWEWGSKLIIRQDKEGHIQLTSILCEWLLYQLHLQSLQEPQWEEAT